MKNLRIVPVVKYADTYGTGDHQSYNEYKIVRDFEESDIWDSKRSRGNDVSAYFKKELIEKGCTVATVSTEEFAKFIIIGLKKKHKIKSN